MKTRRRILKDDEKRCMAEEIFIKRLITELYPSGYISIVCDTYDLWAVITKILPNLKKDILSRDGKVVIRPDSGNPPDIICGNPAGATEEERKGVLQLLAELFGTTTNSNGKKVLNKHIGLIYGDGMYLERYRNTLDRMEAKGFDASNLVIGVGGILRRGTRDSLGLALKATQITRNNEIINIQKSPRTDDKKKSHTGLVRLVQTGPDEFVTQDNCTRAEIDSQYNVMSPVFRNGKILHEYSFNEVRENFLLSVSDMGYNI